MADTRLLDAAADTRVLYGQLQSALQPIRDAKGDWVQIEMAADELIGAAEKNLRATNSALIRLRVIAEQQAARTAQEPRP